MNAGQMLTFGIAIIGLLVGGLGTLQSKRKELIIDTLTKDNLVKTGYIATLEDERTRLKAERDGLQTRVNDYKALAQGSPQLKILSDEVSKLSKTILTLVKKATK